MEKKILFLVFCPPSIRAGGGASIRTSAKRKIYFLGVKDFSALPQTIFVFSPRAERGLGNECARALGRGYGFQSSHECIHDP
jgi:hypothetical protein